MGNTSEYNRAYYQRRKGLDPNWRKDAPSNTPEYNATYYQRRKTEDPTWYLSRVDRERDRHPRKRHYLGPRWRAFLRDYMRQRTDLGQGVSGV